MCRVFMFFGLFVFSSFLSFSQTGPLDYTSKTETVKLDSDTVWIINTGYDLYHQKFNLTLDFSELPSLPTKINWGDNQGDVTSITSSMTHKYEKTELYDIQITGADNRIYHYMVFNKALSTDFEIYPDPFKYCLEVDGDSLLIVKKNFEHNLPGTVYQIIVDPIPLIEDNVNVLYEVSEWFGPNLDSAWVEFKHQTGVKPCNVYLKLNYADEEKNIELEEETNRQRVSVYRAPNVKKIFGFEEPKVGEEIKNMKVCTATRQDYLNLDGDRLNYYQYKQGSFAPTPYYNSYDKAKDLEIHYFYSDTIYENMPEKEWKEVSGQPNMVSVSEEVLFFEPGYYKMMITAKNLCNEVGKIKIDTLWTDRVSWDETKKRYFQVFSHDETKIECKNEKVCLNIPDTIVIVDYNTRRGFEPPPEYKFSAAEYDLTNDAEIITNIWRNGKIIMSGAENAGCDSTVIYIKLNKDDFYGELNLELTKADECDGMVHTFKLNVGQEPVIEKDSIFKALAETTGGLKGVYFNICDTFTYQLPIDTLLMEKYTRGFALDSAYFYIKQGTADEDSLIYRNGKDDELTQLFDSTEVFSYVRIRSYNGCGMVEDTLKLRVNRKPKLELWRDEVSKNDSLCIGVDYTYQWKGSLPDDYWIYLNPPHNPIYVNGKLEEAKQVRLENGDKIRHTVQGKSEENFEIQNKNMRSCVMKSTWEVEVLALPDTLLHPDSVGYCSGSLEINTKKLFETGKSDFKWAEWTLNEDEVKKENFPDVVLTGGVDTLRYKLSRSKGCYVESKLILRPHEMPELKLKDQVKYCLPETVVSFRNESYVDKLSDWKGYNHLTVYEDRIAAVAKRYEDTETGPEDTDHEISNELNGKKWIYKIENTRVDTALMGKCRLLDTVTLSVSDPQLKVLKSDLLVYPWDEYDFAHLEAGNFIDTAQITASTIKWTLRPEGTFWQNVLYGSPYNLTSDDKAKDTLLFELSAESYCGDELKDTLLVELNHLKVKGYKDTICSNEKEYPLWDKVKWSYVDLSSVQWNIVYSLGNKGTISGTGSDAVYTPGEETDSVRIEFVATLENVPTEKMRDTVVLLINPAPVLKISKDTLWACNRRIELKQISSSYIHSANTKGVVHGDYILEPGQAQVGKWSGENYTFEEVILSNFLENISQKVAYEALGLDGCKNAIDTVVLVDPVPAKVNFKRAKEEMCAGDTIKLDTLYTVTGKDQYTHFDWDMASNSSGHIENEHYYVASKPEDKIQELSLVSYKEYTCYDDNPSGQVVGIGPKTLPLTVHREPKFSVVHKFDTLCRNSSEITIERAWVKVETGLYPDYQDSVRVDGLRLLNDGKNFSVNAEGKHEKLVVTVAQGRCSRWNTQSDTIYLYRLPAMLSGSFTVDDVCEGGQAEIDKTNLDINPLASQIKWTATGGTISGDNNYFIPDNDIRQGFVNLTVNAPHNCGTETLSDVPVNIGRKPQLKDREYTICSLEGHPQQISTAVKDPSVVVEKIDWYRCGTTNEKIMTTGASESEWTFTVSAADIQKTELCLLAKIKCGGACRGVFEDTVRIDWQEKPTIAVQPVNVCQGAPEGIDLNLKVQTSNAGLVAWHLQNSAAGTMEGSVFLPGEYNGTTVVNVTAPGLYGCPDEVKPVNITVDAAPKSGIVPNGENCTHRQVTFKPGSKKAQSYDWNFGDGVQVNDEVSAINHVYQNKGTYVITMESHFANGCTRKEEKTWIVNPTPQANFTVPDFAPIAKPVTFNSISLPETVTCNWTIDAVSNYPGPSVSHTFSTDGSHEVQLVVTSLEGCTDTLIQTTTVLDKPVVDFELEVDSCGGVVKIINHSVRNDATVAWDFGNGQSVAEDWEPQPQSYPLVWKDTTYKIILTLSNISDTVKDSISFNMISRLEPAFELWTNTDLCNKTEKEIRILTKGKADTTYVDWGDGTQPDMWLEKDQVNVLAHSYPENTSTSSNDYTIRFRSVNACYHSEQPVEKVITIVPQQIRAKLMEDQAFNKNKCYWDSLAFWNKSFGFIPQGYTCIWDFGDNTSLETDTVSIKPKKHVFEKPGTYTVRLRVKDECNEKVDSVKILVHGNDSLDFAFEKDKSKLCTGDSIRLWLVKQGEEPFTDLCWTLPNGSKPEADTIFYKFKEAGQGNISLKATAGGCSENPLTKSYMVHQTPQPMIDAANVNIEDCTPLKIPFRATNGSGNMDNINVSWDFGDGTSSQEAFPPLKEYETAGQYMVKMKMTSAEECVAWDSVLAVAKITPDAKMELSSHLVCSPDGNFEITALNKTLSPEDYSFEWYRNTEVISMAPDVVTIPFTEFFGKEDIALRAVHKLSLCEHIVKDSIVASYPVKAGLLVSPDTVCSGMEVRFVDTTTVAGTIRQLIFEDGSVVEQQEVARTYPDAGKYAYRFAVTNPAGCTDTLRDTVYVHSLPLAEFYWDKDNSITGLKEIPESDVENGGIRFENLSEFEPLEWEKQGLQYRWDFGDGETSVEKDPGHLFANNGSYEVWLHTVSLMGCRDSVAQVIDISTVKGLFFPNAMVPASDDPGVNRFQPKGIGLQLFTVKIYAQDGTCVWQTDKLDEGHPAEYWDGTFNGQIVPAGTYTWKASAMFIDGTVKSHINGNLIVVR